MDLQTDGPPFQPSAFGVVRELRSELAVDKELEVISASKDANIVPLAAPDIGRGQRAREDAGMGFAILVDDETLPEATVRDWAQFSALLCSAVA